MTFKECVESFPIYDTLVGRYDSDQSFSVPRGKNIDDIETWSENPFWEDSSCYSFVVFLPLIKKFECWNFSFSRVNGYINSSANPKNFYPATYSEDFGWEKVDPKFEDQIILPDEELAKTMGWPIELDYYLINKWRREQVAYLFDKDAYQSGYIFTSPEAVKKFVRERQDLL